ncbi:polysaccharide pyruvyl transferase family protein [Microbacterium pumilum]|uniref:Polysaccharide pyruvyl transferase family protein n=1 Tax=Microbacterium pumilum TaxID=344165 RepID=A0ABP5DQL0_9MICO
MASIKQTLRRSLLATGIEVSRDTRLLAAQIGVVTEPRHHVLIAPPGGGNIGDQAMVEAFLENTDGDVVIVTSGEGSIDIPDIHAARATTRAMPGVLYRSRRAHRAALVELAGVLRHARSISVVGADIMDGAYVPRASVSRAMVASAAALCGIDSRVLGFSWPDAPFGAARSALARAARNGAAILPRDPVSFERLARDGISPDRQVTDLVFSATTVDSALVEELALSGPFAIVNISGHIGRRVDLVPDYVRVVRFLRDRGLAVVILPHVVTPSADDRIPSARLRAEFGSDDVHLVDRVPTPAEVRGLTARAVVTVTGRMHLAIMTLLHGTPAVTLATQGKVEGLMAMLGTPELCVSPVAGVSTLIVDVLDSVLPDASPTRKAIAAALPVVVERSAGNFVGLRDRVVSPAKVGG